MDVYLGYMNSDGHGVTFDGYVRIRYTIRYDTVD